MADAETDGPRPGVAGAEGGRRPAGEPEVFPLRPLSEGRSDGRSDAQGDATTGHGEAAPEHRGIRCALLRGGTSKGAFFLAEDLPADPAARDDLLLRVMGSPDPTQIDGLGGAHPLTSKVAIVSRSSDPHVDVDYLFLQIGVDEPVVADSQTCGNLLAAVGPFAIERGLVAASGATSTVRIRLVNTGDVAAATFATPDGRPDYDGDTEIDGVPGTAGRIAIELAGGGKPLLPTGRVADEIDGHRVTLIDNGMPVVLLRADEFGIAGDEPPAELESRADLRAAVERVRLAAGPAMGLGDVAQQTVPKVFLLSPPAAGGAISTRAFIPARVHTSIGVLMAASVAAGIRIPGAVGSDIARLPDAAGSDAARTGAAGSDAVGSDVAPTDARPTGTGNGCDTGTGDVDPTAVDVTLIEHPTGAFPATVGVEQDADGTWHASSRSVRTARLIFDGTVFPRPRR